MKKVLVFLLLVIMLFSVCACNSVSSTKFMSTSKVKSLVKEYGTPQAELTINYTLDSKNYEIRIKYNLLLSQSPLAVTRFIQLANENFYDDTVIDSYKSSLNYMVMGRYSHIDDKYYNKNSDVTFKGEFASNKYREPKDGYAQFKIFSLAMYHDASTDGSSFDSANGTLILATSNDTLNPNNYAVFAEMVSLTYIVDEKVINENVERVPSSVRENLISKTTTKSFTVYTDETEQKSSSVSMLSQVFTLHVTILGDYDWSKLPKIG